MSGRNVCPKTSGCLLATIHKVPDKGETLLVANHLAKYSIET